jgi:UDP-2,3-diacylglucosamine pyrophosphatase LpxH
MKYRTVMISDTHLGTRGCKDKQLLDFLKSFESEYLFLVGDIIDGWRLKQSFYWNETHNMIIKEILKKSKKGTKVVWIIGNHDEFMRPHLEHFDSFGNIEIVNECEHEMVGKRYWVVHGDEFDGIVRYHKWVAILGDMGYTFLLWANRYFNHLRAALGLGYWSLSAFIKKKVKSAVNFMMEFEASLAREAKKRGYEGVVCGHVHNAVSRDIDGIHYLNTGDFVESCTAVIEKHDKIEILKVS